MFTFKKLTKVNTQILRRLLNRDFRMGCSKDPHDPRDFLFCSRYKSIDRVISKLPSSVDHTPLMSNVRNQGRLGSCVAFAVTALKEWQEAKENIQEIQEGKPDYRKGKEYNYSESWIYWNCKKIDPWPDQEGTSIRFAMKVLNRIGVPCEKAWPYDDVNVGKPESWATMVARWAWIKDYWRLTTIDEIKLALTKNPVPVGILCFKEIFYVKQDGIVPIPKDPNNPIGGHAVCLVGFSDETRMFKFKNSWGTSWGENGYGYISYDYANDFLLDAWTSVDIRVRKTMLKETKQLISN